MLLSEQLKMQRQEFEYVTKRYESAFDDLRDYKISPTLQVTQDLLTLELKKWEIRKNRTQSIIERLENLINTFGDF